MSRLNRQDAGAQRGRVLVTGAEGFVGREVCRLLKARGYRVRPAVRSLEAARVPPDEVVAVGNIGAETQWREALEGIDLVIHLAARVHVMKDPAADPLSAFRAVNTEGTVKLAESAQKAGVRRILYISTIKVNGESTNECPFSEEDPASPRDPYAVSKWEAEGKLADICRKGALEFVIFRPPLVYGPGVKANFLRLLQLVHSGWPLPFKGLENQRSLIGVQNLADAMVQALGHPQAANQLFLVSDGEDLTLEDLIRRIARTAGRPARLFRLPPGLVRSVAKWSGRDDLYRRLFGSLRINSRKICSKLHWSPPLSVDQGLACTVDWFLKSRARDNNERERGGF